jgi:hypothetical protein
VTSRTKAVVAIGRLLPWGDRDGYEPEYRPVVVPTPAEALAQQYVEPYAVCCPLCGEPQAGEPGDAYLPAARLASVRADRCPHGHARPTNAVHGLTFAQALAAWANGAATAGAFLALALDEQAAAWSRERGAADPTPEEWSRLLNAAARRAWEMDAPDHWRGGPRGCAAGLHELWWRTSVALRLTRTAPGVWSVELYGGHFERWDAVERALATPGDGRQEETTMRALTLEVAP